MTAPLTLQRYLGRQIHGAIAFVFVGFLALFAFFDLIRELSDLGKGNYQLRDVFVFIVLSIPTHAYELMPVVVLIGALYALSQLAGNLEFTVMRVSGLSPARAALVLARVGIVYVVASFVLGEWVAPYSEQTAQTLRQRAMSALIARDLDSGLWFKDERTFINIREARFTDSVAGLKVYEFDKSHRLRQVSEAREARFVGGGQWQLSEVVMTDFSDGRPKSSRHALADWRSAVTPELLNVLIVVPERMSIWALYKYMRHLAGNRQKTERYEIALWKKVFYPLATLVMLALALPFGYLQARAGMVGIKVFSGVMIGIFFHMLNSLFAHIGLLQNWPPIGAALAPAGGFLLAAITMMWWVERR